MEEVDFGLWKSKTTSRFYASALDRIWSEGAVNIPWESGRFKVALFGADYQPDWANDKTFADLEGEIESPNYEMGGKTLPDTRKVMAKGVVSAYAGFVYWPDLEMPVQYAVIYEDRGDLADSPLLILHTFESPTKGSPDDPRGVTLFSSKVAIWRCH